MPRGKKRSRKTQKQENSAPISSLALAVATDETLSLLADAGLFSFRGSESEALALLALRGGDNPEEYAPRCFRAEYDPKRKLCEGCVFWASCWQGDDGYLRRLKNGESYPPPYVPTTIITSALKAVKPQVAPPTPRKRK